MDIWNDSSLVAPPVNTYKSSNNAGDFLQIYTVISDAIHTLKNQQILHREAALISRLIYLIGRKFRHDIGYSYIKRTNAALLKYLNLKILNDFQSFISVLPRTSSYSYLPTRQMLEYILIRLQTFSKIMHRIMTCAKKSAIFFFCRLKKGENAWISLIPFAVLSRIWILSRHLFKNSCRWYDVIYNFKDILNIVGVPFIPKNYLFPCNLSEWNGYDSSNEEFEQEWNTYFRSTKNITKDDSYDLLNSFLVDSDCENIAQECTKNVQLTYSVTKNHILHKVDDYGERVSRQEFQQLHDKKLNEQCEASVDNENLASFSPLPKSNGSIVKITDKFIKTKDIKTNCKLQPHISPDESTKVSTKISKTHSLLSVTSLKTLKVFLENEELYRTTSDPNSLTHELGIMQWEALKNILINKMKKIECANDKKTRSYKKLFKIWKERCPVTKESFLS